MWTKASELHQILLLVLVHNFVTEILIVLRISATNQHVCGNKIKHLANWDSHNADPTWHAFYPNVLRFYLLVPHVHKILMVLIFNCVLKELFALRSKKIQLFLYKLLVKVYSLYQ